MKWSLIVLGLFVFGYWMVPFLFRAMKKHDYDNLLHGMQDARISGGSYHEDRHPYRTYTDKYVYGEVR